MTNTVSLPVNAPVLALRDEVWTVDLSPDAASLDPSTWVQTEIAATDMALDRVVLKVEDGVPTDAVVRWTDALLTHVEDVVVALGGAHYLRQIVEEAPAPKGRRAHLVEGHLRSGRSIRVDGDLTVLGDVHAGAEVIASGNVVVLGTLRGVAHAGATGDSKAFVYAMNLRPTQVRIADRITILPDRGTRGPEIVRVLEGAVVVSGSGVSTANRRTTT